MASNKIKKTTANIKAAQGLTKDVKELISVTKETLVEVRELIEHVKQFVDETDFPELKDIKIPKIKLPEKLKMNKNQLLSYNSKNVDWKKLSVGLEKYQHIMEMLYTVDVSVDKNFQKKFNGFYRIRQKPKMFYEVLYNYLEKNKNSNASFETILLHFFNQFERIEASFSSKIAATLNPNLPIWDSIVLKNLGLKSPAYNLSKQVRFEKTVDLYNHLMKFYSDLLNNKLSNKMIADFDKHFPEANISKYKKIDLILWQTRE